MLRLARQLHILFVTTALCTASTIVVLVLQPAAWRQCTGVALFISLISGVLLYKKGRALKIARLIIENQILHVQPIVLKKHSLNKAVRYLTGNSIEVFISCFGILLGSRIIIFNQSEVRLRAVELGKYFITLTFGTDRRIHIARFLLSELRYNELSEIIRKFQYETGITPTFDMQIADT